MNELERLPEQKSKLNDFQTKYNATAKGLAYMLGTNIALYICILLPIVLIGFIWTDFGTPEFGIKYISDSIVTVALLMIGELMMGKVGADGGKLDTDYIASKKEYHSLLDEVHKIGTMFVSVFCEWQIDAELAHALTTRLRALRLTRKDWEELKDIPYKELEQKYGKSRAKKLVALNHLEPIELNEAILLYDSAEDALERGGVPISGDGYMYKKTHSPSVLISCILTGLLTVSVAVTLTSDFSYARVMYTAFKVIILLFKMAQGYQRGAKAYNSIEVRQYQAKSNYLRQYIRFVEDKTYLKLDDKYGDIECLTCETDTTTND